VVDPPADEEADALMAVVTSGLAASAARSRWSPSWRMVLRNYLVHRRSKVFFLTGFLEPVLYLFSIGIGVGQLVEPFEFNGQLVGYAAFVAPGMLAASAMNGAVLDSTFSIYFKLKFEKLYDAVLATPMRTFDVARGEITWALLRGGVYSVGFLVVMLLMGLVDSWWAVLAVPATLLVGFAFSAVCMALTTFMRSWQDFDLVTLGVMPLFLFSATFFPITQYPGVLRWVVELTPLYRGVVLCRELTTGAVTWASAVSVVYLVTMGLIGLAVVSRRLGALLLR
jgi:lipooligosaccharide transport system permease protein